MFQSMNTFIHHVVLGVMLVLGSGAVYAHQPDVSSTVLIEREDSSMILHIRGSLTAFQYAIQAHYGDSAYASPEAFKELVFEHMRANVGVIFNETDTAVIEDIHVKLGHETSVLFAVKGIPDEVASIYVKNSGFSNIHRNKSALVILKEGFPREQVMLNNQNMHAATCFSKESEALFADSAKGSGIPLYMYGIVSTLLLALGGVFLIKKKKLVGG